MAQSPTIGQLAADPPADTPATSAQDPPDTVEEVTASIQDTLLGIWSDFIDHIPYLVAGLVILLLTWGVAGVVGRLLYRSLGRSKMRGSLKELVVRLTSIGLWMLGVLLAAMVVFPGLTPARALGALGLVSVAVGLAFKDVFENFFAGILLLWRFPFENGDFIECKGITGRVQDVTIRNTLIRKTSGELVVVPNSTLFLNPVQILTNLPRRRVTIIAGIAYGEDVTRAVGVIEQAVKTCTTVLTDQPVQVFPQGFGSSSIDIEVTWWTGAKPVDIRRSRGEVVTAVKAALDGAGIEIPFPYRTLTFKEPLGLVQEGRED